jgi:hypothetical protein
VIVRGLHSLCCSALPATALRSSSGLRLGIIASFRGTRPAVEAYGPGDRRANEMPWKLPGRVSRLSEGIGCSLVWVWDCVTPNAFRGRCYYPRLLSKNRLCPLDESLGNALVDPHSTARGFSWHPTREAACLA